MQTTMPKIKQRSFLYPDLMDQLNPKHPLMILSKKIPWECFDEEFAENYTDFGRPAKPTRLMVGILILKQMYNLSDEKVVKPGSKIHIFKLFVAKPNSSGNSLVLLLILLISVTVSEKKGYRKFLKYLSSYMKIKL